MFTYIFIDVTTKTKEGLFAIKSGLKYNIISCQIALDRLICINAALVSSVYPPSKFRYINIAFERIALRLC